METAVKIEKGIEKLCTLEKFDNFLNVVNLYHIEKCGGVDYGTCTFICNLRYLYVETVLHTTSNVENLQKYCRNNYDFFYVIITFSHQILEIEREKIEIVKITKKIN